jgi:hypothetical protein
MIIESDNIKDEKINAIKFLGKKQKKFVITPNDIFFSRVNEKIDGEELDINKYEKKTIEINGIKYTNYNKVQEINMDKIDDSLDFVDMPFEKTIEENINEKDLKIIVDVDTFTENMIYFTFNVENYIKKDGIKLVLNIVNDNLMNFIQLDGTPDSFISRLVLFANDKFIESFDNYSDISYMKSVLFGKPLFTRETIFIDNEKAMILSPINKIDNSVFCPSVIKEKFDSRINFVDGKYDIQDFTKWKVEIPLKMKSFISNYNCISENIIGKKITIGIELNRNAMFVPVFKSNLEDLTGISITNTKSYYYYCLNDIYEFLYSIKWNTDKLKENVRNVISITDPVLNQAGGAAGLELLGGKHLRLGCRC